MIGGLMLMMAIGAMLIICFEADMGDDLADLARRSGLLAMRPPKGAAASSAKASSRRTRASKAKAPEASVSVSV